MSDRGAELWRFFLFFFFYRIHFTPWIYTLSWAPTFAYILVLSSVNAFFETGVTPGRFRSLKRMIKNRKNRTFLPFSSSVSLAFEICFFSCCILYSRIPYKTQLFYPQKSFGFLSLLFCLFFGDHAHWNVILKMIIEHRQILCIRSIDYGDRLVSRRRR